MQPTPSTSTPSTSTPSAPRSVGDSSSVGDSVGPIDIRLRLSALWIAVMFVYAYVDIFNLMREDFLTSLLEGEIVNTPLEVNQGFLIFAVAYILPASLMVYLSLTLRPKVNRRANVVVAGVYAMTIALSCIGETWIFYFFGSAVELVLLAMIIRLARQWAR